MRSHLRGQRHSWVLSGRCAPVTRGSAQHLGASCFSGCCPNPRCHVVLNTQWKLAAGPRGARPSALGACGH